MSLEIERFIGQLPEERVEAVQKLREVILNTIPDGFSESLNGHFISYDVPHSIFPAGYHCNPAQPLPFVSIASQKNFVALYHMGIYADQQLLAWFQEEYPQHCKTKLDMGKSCIRFKKMDDIPYKLIGELMRKMNVNDWIEIYQKNIKR